MDESLNIKEMTQQLKQHLHELLDRFETSDPPKSFSDKSFFLHMKRQTAPMYDLLEQWEQEALQLVKERRLSVHPHQITATRENIELIILHSFYKDTRRRRYMELQQSSHYIFDQILRDLSRDSHLNI